MAQSIKAIGRDMRRLNPRALCQTCRRSIHNQVHYQHHRPRYASTAAAPAQSSDPIASIAQHSQSIPPISTATATSSAWTVHAGVVLSRPPQITRELTAFEKAFFLYQRRMNERTAMPFPRYFYIPKETPADVDWKRKMRERRTPARDIGNWSAWDRQQGWNDEVLVGSTLGEPEEHMRKLLEDAEVREEGAGAAGAGQQQKDNKDVVERPHSRVTEADRTSDTKSLNRALARTLYLLVKNKDGRWVFPNGLLEGQESLARAAERLLVQTGGINMNTWMVGNAPVGHHTARPGQHATKQGQKGDSNQGLESSEQGTKTYFMKARIMAGKTDLKDNPFGLVDHQWLTREELQKAVTPGYWSSVKNMLAEL